MIQKYFLGLIVSVLSILCFSLSKIIYKYDMFSILYLSNVILNFFIIAILFFIFFTAINFSYLRLFYKVILSFKTIKEIFYFIFEHMLYLLLLVGILFNIAFIEQVYGIQNDYYNTIAFSFLVPSLVSLSFCVFIIFIYHTQKRLKNYIMPLISVASFIWIFLAFGSNILFDMIDKSYSEKIALEYAHPNTNNFNIFQGDEFLEKAFCFDLDKAYCVEKNENNNILYTIRGNEKLNLAIKKDLGLTQVIFDEQDILSTALDHNSSHIILTTSYDLKPGEYSLKLKNDSSAKEYIFNIKYIYSSDNSKNIFDTWKTKKDTFVSITPEGLLLQNSTKTNDYLGHKRRFDDEKISFEMIFAPKNNSKIDFSIYFGERTYIVFNNKNIEIRQTLKDGKGIQTVEKTPYAKFKLDTFYTIKIIRIGKIYEVYLNDELKLQYLDNNDEAIFDEKFRNIGLSFVKSGTSILISKMVIQ